MEKQAFTKIILNRVRMQSISTPLHAHPVLFDKPLTPHARQVTVLPDQLHLAVLQQHH